MITKHYNNYKRIIVADKVKMVMSSNALVIAVLTFLVVKIWKK